ncbi:hypothetical protein GQ53DRAFT_831551 [Thozetella sp. PMI_491]|nr:hypothetical protein GQ53DRAFT_831551 [Thozetella sp. PMI_491]
MAGQEIRPSLSSQFDWHAKFGRRSYLNYQDEDASWDKVRRQYRDSPADLTTSTIKFFLGIDDDSPEIFYRAEQIEVLCSEIDMDKLRRNNESISSQAAAWLNEMSPCGEEMKFRQHPCPLHPQQVYAALREKRFHDANSPERTGVPDAERRLLYITDLDSIMVAAIILTASYRFAWAMSSFLFHHIGLHPQVHIRILHNKPAVFSMEFHLPFYAWRRHGTLREDTRKKANGEPLRKSRALAFLVSKDPDGLDDQDCVYESCVSCTVTGYNDFVWTACLAVDTYFSDVNETKDKVSDYGDEDVIFSDPLLAPYNRYMHDPARPILDPRAYFLAVFSAWIKRVENEWGNVIFRLRCGIEQFTKTSKELFGIQNDDQLTEALRKGYNCTDEAEELLVKFSNTLEEVANAWRAIESQFSNQYFKTKPGSEMEEKFTSYLHEIGHAHSVLRNYRIQLGHLSELCERYRRQLELFLHLRGNHGVVLQEWNITLFYFLSPPALAASLLQSGVVVMESQLLCFFILTAGIAAATYTLKPAWTWISRRRHARAVARIPALETMDTMSPIPESYALPLSYHLPRLPARTYTSKQASNWSEA